MPVVKELCRGQYTAEQTGRIVTIFASGTHPTPGYETFFEPARKVNTFFLFHLRPTEIIIQPVWPFSKHISYYSKDVVETVDILDVTGSNIVPVKQKPLSDAEMALFKGGGDALPWSLGGGGSGTFPFEADDPGSRTLYRWEATGYSKSLQFEEALQNAIASLPAVQIPEARLAMHVVSIDVEGGTFPGGNRLAVRIAAWLQ